MYRNYIFYAETSFEIPARGPDLISYSLSADTELMSYCFISWYLGDASRQRAEAMLMKEETEGCFVVRNSSTTNGLYTLSVYSKNSRVHVKHYHIKTDAESGLFYLSNSIKCASIPELIYR